MQRKDMNKSLKTSNTNSFFSPNFNQNGRPRKGKGRVAKSLAKYKNTYKNIKIHTQKKPNTTY